MRRNDREIIDIPEKLKVLEKCKVCRLGLSDKERPYIVPLNFGYTFVDNKLTLYFHSANEGRKIDIMKSNNRACFEIDTDHQLIEGANACKCSYSYTSIIGVGLVEFINEPEEKAASLNILMKHQTGKDIQHSYSEEALASVTVFRMIVEEFTCKQRPAVS